MFYLLKEDGKNIDSSYLKLFSQLYQEEKGLTQKQLAKRVEISKPTVKKGLNFLIKKDLVSKVGKKNTKIGRKPAMYTLTTEDRFWMGIDLRMPDLTISLYDLSHHLIDHIDTVVPPKQQQNTENLQNYLLDHIQSFIQSTGIERNNLMGVGIGVPGIVSSGNFTPFSRGTTDVEYQIQEFLESGLQTPITISNDVDAELLSEISQNNSFFEEKEIAIFFAAHHNKGSSSPIRIGGSIFYKGDIFKGRVGTSGEFGHTSISVDIDEGLDLQPECGNPKCLETYINAKLNESGGSKIPEKVIEVIKDEIKDLIFAFTPDVIIISMEALPNIKSSIINDTQKFAVSLVEKWGHDKIAVREPRETSLACSRGASIDTMRDFFSTPDKYWEEEIVI